MTHADEMAIQYLAQQLYLDAEQRKSNGVRMGLRWGVAGDSRKKKWLKEARRHVQSWLDDEIRAANSRGAHLIPVASRQAKP